MALPSLTLRTTKGSALTYAEADANFTNLSTATTRVLVGSTTTTLALNDTLTLAAGANVTLSADSASKTVTITAAGGSGITDIVSDTTPQLGGDLDVNGKNIVSTSNGSITLAPNGTGLVVLSTNEVRVGDVDATATITSQGAGNLVLNTNYASGTSGAITIAQGTNANITLAPNGSGNVVLDGQNWPQSSGSANQFLKTDGSGQTSWSALTTATGAVVGGIKVGSNLTITGDGTLSAGAPYTLSTATASTLGGVKIGANIAAAVDGTIKAAPTGADTQLQFNNAGTFGASSSLTWNGTDLSTPNLVLSNSNVNEGGEMRFALPSSGSTLTTSVTMDIYQNKLRIFETGGTNRGGYFDISALAATVGTNLAAGGGGSAGVSSITFGSTGLTPSSATTGTVTVGGVLNVANGGLGTSEVAGVGRIPIGNGSNYVPAFLTAGSGIAITTGSGTVSIAATGGASAETVYAYTFSATFAPNWTNGTIQTTTITANITSLAFTSPTSGQTITIVATQGGSGSYTLPASSSTLKYANATRSLSTAVGAIDLITISYIGTVYYVSVTRGFA